MEFDGLTRLCLFVDVQGYGQRPMADQSRIQGWLVEVIERAREGAGLSKEEVVKQDQGDGALLLIHPHIPMPRVLPRLVSALVEAVEWVNEPLRETSRIKLRAALDAGVVHQAANGYVGRAIVSAARIVGSGPLRTALNGTHGISVALAISDSLYQDVVMSGLPGLPSGKFQEIAVQEKEYAGWAWLLVQRESNSVATIQEPHDKSRPNSEEH
ncbi:hypothetical protein [Streptomyces sp. NBC_00986]|uniref:hypothetical protein n=1 Tax=Streptomyces sp. NBC_00986 TaxID=2903702 RepID=UPI00386815D6|nr:hypothetical protein OG504_21085 [Streptomyces sp. NBC_00986]